MVVVATNICIQVMFSICFQLFWVCTGYLGFLGSSAGKESACFARDPSSIPGSGRSPGEGIGYPLQHSWASLGGTDGKESACNVGDLGSIPGLGRSPRGRRGNPLQYSCLEHPWVQRSLVGYNPWGHKESDTTAQLSTAQHRMKMVSSLGGSN